MESEEMETFWFFRLRFRRAYESANYFDFRFSLGHELFYDSVSDYVASENQPWDVMVIGRKLKEVDTDF